MHRSAFYSLLLGVLLFTSVVRAGAPSSQPVANLGYNAALRYWAAFELMPRSDADQKITDDWRQAPLDHATADLLERSRNSFRSLHAGAQIPQCDWGLDFAEGVNLLLPHLNRARAMTSLACLRVRYDLGQQRFSDAVDDLSDILICARHAGADGPLICLLVQFGMERAAIDAIAPGLNKLDAASLARLAQRLDQLPPGSTLLSAIRAESELTVDPFVQSIKDAGPNPDWSHIFAAMKDPAGNPSIDDLVKSAGGTSDAVISQLENLSNYYDEIAAVLAKPISQEEFYKQNDAIIHRFDANPFAKILLPAFNKAYDNALAAQTRMSLLKAAIAVIQHGPDVLAQVPNLADGRAFTYALRANGFQLSSNISVGNQPVTLVVGADR